jgi:hypothetical protein
MTTMMIFLLGVLVTLVTLTAVVLVGLSEAADPAHSRPEDLTAWEQSLVGAEREASAASRARDEEKR